MLRVALVSASPLVRAGLERGLDGFETVLSCASLEEARGAGFGGADVAIVDGVEAADELRGDAPPLVLLGLAEQAPTGDLLGEGISVLPSDAPLDAIEAAALAAVRGLVATTPRLIARALGAAEDEPHPEIEELTPREREVLAQLALGLANREIAEALDISTHTAKFHVAQIIAKLCARSRAHAVAKAMQAGIV